MERPGDELLARVRQVATKVDRETTAATLADGKRGRLTWSARCCSTC